MIIGDMDLPFVWWWFGSVVADSLTGVVAGATACGVLAVLGNEVIGIKGAAWRGGVIALVAGVAVTIATYWLQFTYFWAHPLWGYGLAVEWVISPAIASLVFAGMISGIVWRATLAVEAPDPFQAGDAVEYVAVAVFEHIDP